MLHVGALFQDRKVIAFTEVLYIDIHGSICNLNFLIK